MYRDNIVGIYHLVHRRVGNAADAEDLAEEVLMHTLKTLRLSASVNNVRAYLVKTARRCWPTTGCASPPRCRPMNLGRSR
jgi:DNA-directed RNA polymerase specialized sigma24 family protein